MRTEASTLALASTVCAVSIGAGPPIAGGQDGGRSVRDGIYTAAQAEQGGSTFQRVCRSCHTVAEHTGKRFSGKYSGITLGELFLTISNTMPEGDPGSLAPEEYVGIVAFFLEETGYPEGAQTLPADAAVLERIRIEPPN